MRIRMMLALVVIIISLGMNLPAAAQMNIPFFSHDLPGIGLPGTAVFQEWQYNTADIFWCDANIGWNFLCLWDWNLGLDCRDDLDALDDREPEPDVEMVYFSLTPGSPTLANGAFFPNWRAGFTNLTAGASFNTSWSQNFPAVASIIGSNMFQLIAEDVTPAPYNQCPYPPSGDMATSTCVVVANTP
jgi:hypothetical protein